MASVVCQGLQSCLEPQIVEPLVLKHQLLPLKPNHPKSFVLKNSSNQEKNGDANFVHDNKKGELGGWNFIEALTNNIITCKKEKDEQKVYVHPLDKTNSAPLSLKSLEMCTESLGSETGSDISESIDELSSSSWERMKIKRLEFTKKTSFSAGFPPPLTSISGSDIVKVKPRRENGRLVMQAVNITPTPTNFQAERINGRLRLTFLKDSSAYSDKNDVMSNKEKEEEFSDEEVHEEEEDEDNENFDEDEDGDGDDDDYWEEDMNANNENVEHENEINEESARPSRCKLENNGSGNCKGMPIWGPYCVAIS